jgi:hypothetical protein
MLRPLAQSPVYTEWTVVAASRALDPLYRGSSWEAALGAVRGGEWIYPEGDLQRVLTSAVLSRGNVPGTVLWITDRVREGVPAGVQTLAFGEPIANTGWAGLRVWQEGDQTAWEGIVRNWSQSEQRREWFWNDAGGQTPAESVLLPPGGLVTLRGVFPAGVTRGRLSLGGDGFALDDSLEVIAPQPRPVLVGCMLPEPNAVEWTRRVAATVPGANFVKEGNVQVLVAGATRASRERSGALVLFAEREFPARPGAVVGEEHPLVSGLDWQGLLVGGVGDLNPEPGDAVLVWRGGQPLVWFSSPAGRPRLWFNFPWGKSNADRLPAVVLLMGRFLAQVQSTADAFGRENAFVGDPLPIVSGKGWRMRFGSGTELDLPARSTVRAPFSPGFFQVVDADQKTVFEGAAQFVDPRESDFAAATTFGEIGEMGEQWDRQQTEPDAFTELWVLLAGLAMLGAWLTSTRAPTPVRTPVTANGGGRDAV